MAINHEKAIQWMSERRGKVTYSMTRRGGPNSYDCSSSIYFALLSAGASALSYPATTETAHNWLTSNGYVLHAQNKDWNMQRHDVIIWGVKGQSVGAGGHIMLAVDAENVIHCNYSRNGITVDNYNQLYGWNRGTMGGPYVYVYRPKAVPTQSAPVAKATHSASSAPGSLEQLASEVMAGKHGSGEVRKQSLGPKFTAVQTIVNERLKAITYQVSHQRLADEVLKGNLGAGEERKRNLGSYYQAVQNIINKR